MQWSAAMEWKRHPVERWTLRQVAECGALVFECQRCERLAEADVLALIDRHGGDARVEQVRLRMVCRGCGERQPRSLVHLKGVRRERAWLPSPPRAGR